jgi:pimeloyl-ACP methyl ester carboxylesterase
LFVEGHELLHEWFPQCHDADIPDASHLLQMEAPGPVAAAIAAFCSDALQAPPLR